MDQKIREQWVQALRSGEYRAPERLTGDEGYEQCLFWQVIAAQPDAVAVQR